VFPQVASVLANLPTYSASVRQGPFLDNVLIQLLVPSCKQLGSISVSGRMFVG
jgi:hypothetical protein